jgi:hypothetical protein
MTVYTAWITRTLGDRTPNAGPIYLATDRTEARHEP